MNTSVPYERESRWNVIFLLFCCLVCCHVVDCCVVLLLIRCWAVVFLVMLLWCSCCVPLQSCCFVVLLWLLRCFGCGCGVVVVVVLLLTCCWVVVLLGCWVIVGEMRDDDEIERAMRDERDDTFWQKNFSRDERDMGAGGTVDHNLCSTRNIA